MESLGRLCDRYVRFPGDVEGLAVVETLVNIVFEKADCPPPSRIRVVFGSNGTILLGFEGDDFDDDCHPIGFGTENRDGRKLNLFILIFGVLITQPNGEPNVISA